MINVSSVRLTAPKAASEEIVRRELLDTVLRSQDKLIYIHAGAGYGKTTLLSQIANSLENTVWLSLDGENDIFTFVSTLGEAIRQSFPDYNFTVSEYFPFENRDNFITILANGLINSIEKLSENFMIIIDDLHTVEDLRIKKLITGVIKYKPDNIPLCLGSMEAPSQELIPLRIRGNILELTQKELAFTRNESAQILGFNDEKIYRVTEGWPLAIGSFKVLLKNGISIADIPVRGNEALHYFNNEQYTKAAKYAILSEDKELYIEAMLHKARVLRNSVSFEESNKLLDELIPEVESLASEITYAVVIEKLYNLCWNVQIKEAYDIIYHMIEVCAKAGNMKVKSWFERYLSAVHFFAGRMKDAVYYYEKSLNLPESERQYLNTHSIGMYAAKAYQMLGDESKAISMISDELQNLRFSGRYEELWAAYLLAAEIHYQNTFINRMNGGNQTYETTVKYCNLADEYAPLYRNTEFQMQWAKMQRLTFSLIFTAGSKRCIIDEIFADLDKVSAYLKTIILGRLFGYFCAVSDFSNAVKCARLCIEVGERSNIMLLPTLAYGILARAAIAMNDQMKAVGMTKRYLQLCSENGIYEYFRMRKAYDPILEFALDNEIEPDFTKQMMDFAGYKTKKA